MSEFKDMIASNFPVAGEPAPRKAPPPLPAKKTPPPLPPKKPVVDSNGFTLTGGQKFDTKTGEQIVDDSGNALGSAADRLRAIAAALPAMNPDTTPPVIEKGYINPPDSPAVLAATPEEAVAVQGIVAPPPPVADELDGMTKTQLLAECEALGVPAADTKGKRETGLRKLVRDRRALLASGAKVDEAAASGDETTLAEAIVETVAGLEAVGLIDANTASAITAPLTEEPDMTKSDKPKFTLYVNCLPDGGVDASQADLVARGNAMIKEQSGIEDYRLIDYGKGGGYLALAVKDALESGEFGAVTSVAVDTRTPEGQALVTMLASLADWTVRGV